jgi:hypothetical protein
MMPMCSVDAQCTPVRTGRDRTAHSAPATCLPQVEGCSEDLSCAKSYFQRFKVCSEHLKMFSLLVDGKPSRFCQQCGKFHELTAFDGKKRWVACSRLCRSNIRVHAGPNLQLWATSSCCNSRDHGC